MLVNEEKYKKVYLPIIHKEVYLSRLIADDFVNELNDFFVMLSMLGYAIRANEDSSGIVRYGIYGDEKAYVFILNLTTRRIIDNVCVFTECCKFREKMREHIKQKVFSLSGDSYYVAKTHLSKLSLVGVLKEHCIKQPIK